MHPKDATTITEFATATAEALKGITEAHNRLFDRVDALEKRITAAPDDEVTRLRDRVNELEAERRWIPVTERLPKLLTDVICHSQYGAIGTGYLVSTSEWSGWDMRQIGSCAVTHWMPLPNTPDQL